MKKWYLVFILATSAGILPGCSKSKSDPTPAATGKFVFNGVVYSGPASAVTYNGTLEVTISSAGKSITFYNVPSAGAGTFTIYNAFTTGVLQSTTDVYGSSDIEIANLAPGSSSLNGTFTKSGARSFTFTGVFQADLASKSTAEVTGSGTY
jgi:hypothetical protein